VSQFFVFFLVFSHPVKDLIVLASNMLKITFSYFRSLRFHDKPSCQPMERTSIRHYGCTATLGLQARLPCFVVHIWICLCDT